MEKPVPSVRQAPRPDSKAQQKKIAKKQKVEYRAQKAQERKEQVKVRPPVEHIHEPGWVQVPRTAEEHERLKKERFDHKWKRREAAAVRMNNSPYALAFDLSYNPAMTERELTSLAMQINTTFAWMRKAKLPFQINLCNYKSGSRVDIELRKLLPTEQTWSGIKVYEGPIENVFSLDKLIYMSPDATDVLDKVETGKVYVLGGLVDGTRIKGASYLRASSLGIRSARIPVHEMMDTSRDPVLNINHVAELLSHQAQTNDWQTSWHTLIASEKLTRFKLREGDEKDGAEEAKEGESPVAIDAVPPAAAGVTKGGVK